MAKSAKNEKAPEQEAPEEEEENTSPENVEENAEEAPSEEQAEEAKPAKKTKKAARKPVEHGVFMVENVMHNGKEFIVGQPVPMAFADYFIEEGFAEER